MKPQGAICFEVMGFCHDHGWPPELMKKIFFLLYEKDIVFEDGFLHWRESLAKMTPGKDEALLQVAEFFAWLEPLTSFRVNIVVAAAQGDTEELTRLISLPGIDLDCRDDREYTALSMAVGQEQLECARLLIDANANLAVTDATRRGSQLCMACMGKVDGVRLLLEANAKVDLDNGFAQTGLFGCAMGQMTQDGRVIPDEDKNVECARLLLEAGATVNHSTPGYTPAFRLPGDGDVLHVSRDATGARHAQVYPCAARRER